MTVFNARRFVRETLDSLLAQDYPNLELVISDNASTDGSSEIGQQYAARDPRIRYYRNDTNIGAVRNWNRALELSRGQYFMWASDHDLWRPGYISACVSWLTNEDDTVLVYSPAEFVDENGHHLADSVDEMDTTALHTRDRFSRVVWNLRRCHMVHGVIRASVLKHLGGFPNCWAMDLALLPALSLFGSFRRLPETYYLRRENRAAASDSTGEHTRAFQLAQLDPAHAKVRSTRLPHQLYRETRDALLALMKRAPITRRARMSLSCVVLHAYWARYGVGYGGLQHVRYIIPRRFRAALPTRVN